MVSDMQTTLDEISRIYSEATCELLASYGLEAREIERAPGKTSLCSVLGITGDCIKIVSLLQPEESLLKQLYPGDGNSLNQREIEDWCGEINNQLAGRMKNKLLDRGCEVMLGLPSVVVGREISANQPSDAHTAKLHFDTAGGSLWAHNSVRIDPEFQLLPMGAARNEGLLREGEISLF